MHAATSRTGGLAATPTPRRRRIPRPGRYAWTLDLLVGLKALNRDLDGDRREIGLATGLMVRDVDVALDALTGRTPSQALDALIDRGLARSLTPKVIGVPCHFQRRLDRLGVL
mgnify:CR=1 FL=1